MCMSAHCKIVAAPLGKDTLQACPDAIVTIITFRIGVKLDLEVVIAGRCLALGTVGVAGPFGSKIKVLDAGTADEAVRSNR